VVLNKHVGGIFFHLLQVKMHFFGKIANLIKGKSILACFFWGINRRMDMLVRSTRVAEDGGTSNES
jgi:hypothetical protein